ncbi:MAG: hypothetical protein LBB48_08205 [Treponema sp.]|jgi:hypothetical protein|nr:hypothetical protein [Treponema sp.]
MNVQNKKTSIEDVQVVVDEVIVNTVFDIFDAVVRLNPLQDLFKDLSEKLITELSIQSFMEYNLELSEDQRGALSGAVAAKGNETARTYLANLKKDERTQKVYDIVKEKTKGIADAVLSSIGQEINRGAIINAVAVQANAKSEKVDEILLQKTKASGDITIPTNCILISTNCVSVIKSSCERQTTEQKRNGEGDTEDETKTETAADEPNIDEELDISLHEAEDGEE